MGVSSRQYPRLLIQPQDAVRQSCRQEEGRWQGQGQVGSEEDGEDEEGVEEGGEEEGEDNRKEGEDKEAFWCQARERAKEKGDQGREEKVKDGKGELAVLTALFSTIIPFLPLRVQIKTGIRQKKKKKGKIPKKKKKKKKKK